MLSQHKERLHRTETGDADQAGPGEVGGNKIQTTDSSGTRIEAIHHRAVLQSLNIENPPDQRKTFRISHLNSYKRRVALDELTLVRSRDDLLLITDPPLTDGNPPELDGYVLVSAQGSEARTCIYI